MLGREGVGWAHTETAPSGRRPGQAASPPTAQLCPCRAPALPACASWPLHHLHHCPAARTLVGSQVAGAARRWHSCRLHIKVQAVDGKPLTELLMRVRLPHRCSDFLSSLLSKGVAMSIRMRVLAVIFFHGPYHRGVICI